VIFPCICVLQPQLVHLYQSFSLFPISPPMVALANLGFLYSSCTEITPTTFKFLVSFLVLSLPRVTSP
jgi:hypothetical protein